MKKLQHEYIQQGKFPVNSIAFTVTLDKITYGDYDEGITPENKFRRLRGLVMTKHQIIEVAKHIKNNQLSL